MSWRSRTANSSRADFVNNSFVFNYRHLWRQWHSNSDIPRHCFILFTLHFPKNDSNQAGKKSICGDEMKFIRGSIEIIWSDGTPKDKYKKNYLGPHRRLNLGGASVANHEQSKYETAGSVGVGVAISPHPVGVWGSGSKWFWKYCFISKLFGSTWGLV